MKYVKRSLKSTLALSLVILSHSVFASTVPDLVLTSIKNASKSLNGARVGVSFYDMNSGEGYQFNGQQRFPMASTFKVLACATALKKGVMSQKEPILKSDLEEYSPITKKHINEIMTIEQLCDATMSWSDNTAANLILKSVGGPKGVTEFLRDAGDKTTNLSRWEPELNQATPGDDRDTTTPIAMNRTLRELLFGGVLSPDQQSQLFAWMKGDKVANDLLRSVLPKGWQIGDKTGYGGHGSRGIVASLVPPSGQPLVITIYLTENKASLAELNKAIAQIGDAMIQDFERNHHTADKQSS
ncbi:class A beta-lactamase [Vibrio sp. S4M6]|uniref:class A beta-lactamase n=1 Tax=Vibrio sinus TaxID=2946865 RepID=UPI00202A8C4C|nr:class A beta-lactamase [Vibrio sinus]MCL9782695.1 class A beta-lactamase [Vibrio sinus]